MDFSSWPSVELHLNITDEFGDDKLRVERKKLGFKYKRVIKKLLTGKIQSWR